MAIFTTKIDNYKNYFIYAYYKEIVKKSLKHKKPKIYKE
jgi:hypothetical protein